MTPAPSSLEAQPARRSSRRRFLRILAIVAVVVAAIASVLLVWALIEPRTLVVKQAIVTSPDVPAAFHGARIVYVSDIHAGDLLGEQRVKRVVDRINELEPDVVLLGGDFIDGGEGGEEMWSEQVRRIRTELGTFAVLGNHDWGDNEEWSRSTLESAGVTIVDNDNVRLLNGSGWLRICGVEDYWQGQPDFAAASRDISRDEFAILLSHNPDALADGLPPVAGAFDLALAGHTHGGQVNLFGWAPLAPTEYGDRYLTGWRTEEGTPILVSNGTGLWGLPIRLGAPPQIHLLELRSGRTTSVAE